MQCFTSLLTITAGGTPVQVSTDPALRACSLLLKALSSNAGPAVYVGNASNFGKTTGVNLIRDINGTDADFSISSREGRNTIPLAGYWVDGTTGDKVLATWWQE